MQNKVKIERFDPLWAFTDDDGIFYCPKALVLASTGSGKSVMMLDLMRKLQKYIFNCILLSRTDDQKKTFLSHLPAMNYYKSYKPGMMYKLMKEQAELYQIIEKQYAHVQDPQKRETLIAKKFPGVLMVVDDYNDDTEFYKSKELVSFFTTGRHQNIGCFVAQHRYKLLPPIVRDSCQHIILIGMVGTDTLQEIHKAYCNNLDFGTFQNVVHETLDIERRAVIISMKSSFNPRRQPQLSYFEADVDPVDRKPVCKKIPFLLCNPLFYQVSDQFYSGEKRTLTIDDKALSRRNKKGKKASEPMEVVFD